MGSRKEEERNEKIIRGLMKLPPNRRCINCNSLGPQYVCTNFWTFVCMTCSGIHREFTHRVKSVSMAKFTSQEVEALQNGGNQRAREIYLKDWDSQRQRLPDSSNVEKIRQFIRNVYVDRRYAGGKASEKPPRDMQASLGSREDDTRRASSYHSYSQSPPYDYQYEDRRYGKQAAVLTRKPGSDRGNYVGKISSFIYSPGRMSEQMFEDRFANEGSGSRISDYSVSSGGDPFRSGTESPNFSSPRIQPSRDVLSSNASVKRELDGIPRPQRTTSSGSIASLESNSLSLKSNNSGSFVDAGVEPERATGTHHNKVSSFTQSSNTVNYGGLDLFEAQVVPEKPATSSAPPIDLFQLPAASSAPPVNTLHMTHASSASPANLYQPPQTSRASSLTLFDIAEQPSTVALGTKSQEVSNTGNEGWATFDTSLPAPSIPETASINSATMPNGSSSVKFDQYSSFNTSMQWSAFHDSGAHRPAPSSDLGFDNVQAPTIVTNTQSWNAFDDSTSHYPLEGVKQGSESQSAAYEPSSTVDQCLSSIVPEDSNIVGSRIAASHPGPPKGPGPSHIDMGPSYTPTVLSQMEEVPAAVTDRKSTNPFDFPYDSDFEQSNMFLDVSSLHAALPNEQLPSTFIGGVGQSWFPQNAVTPYIPAAQGGLAYMAGQAPSSQLSNVSAQGSVASIGGNPFA